jgi:hypothetical protein
MAAGQNGALLSPPRLLGKGGKAMTEQTFPMRIP